jgi:hypothetical protein
MSTAAKQLVQLAQSARYFERPTLVHEAGDEPGSGWKVQVAEWLVELLVERRRLGRGRQRRVDEVERASRRPSLHDVVRHADDRPDVRQPAHGPMVEVAQAQVNAPA